MAMRRAHQEMVRHLRHRIKVAGIQARVRGFVSCGDEVVQVNTTHPDRQFTDDEQRTIRTIGDANRLTWVRGMPIDVEQMTNPYDFNFYMPAAEPAAPEVRPAQGQSVAIRRGEWAGEAGTVDAVRHGSRLDVWIGRTETLVTVLANSVDLY